MTRVDDKHANAPAVWRNDNRPLYLKDAEIQKYKLASQLSFSNVVCEYGAPGDSVCNIPDFDVPVNGLAVFRFKMIQ